MVLVSPHDLAQSPQVNALEALLEGSSNFHAMLDMPPDADDERMVELAIALSLQEQGGSHGGGLSLHGIMGGHQQVCLSQDMIQPEYWLSLVGCRRKKRML